jgi:ABC-type transporter Mla subunit MlaD
MPIIDVLNDETEEALRQLIIRAAAAANEGKSFLGILAPEIVDTLNKLERISDQTGEVSASAKRLLDTLNEKVPETLDAVKKFFEEGQFTVKIERPAV